MSLSKNNNKMSSQEEVHFFQLLVFENPLFEFVYSSKFLLDIDIS